MHWSELDPAVMAMPWQSSGRLECDDSDEGCSCRCIVTIGDVDAQKGLLSAKDPPARAAIAPLVSPQPLSEVHPYPNAIQWHMFATTKKIAISIKPRGSSPWRETTQYPNKIWLERAKWQSTMARKVQLNRAQRYGETTPFREARRFPLA